MTFCPTSCDVLRDAPEPSLDVEFGCPTNG
jgi:hypothetical protein